MTAPLDWLTVLANDDDDFEDTTPTLSEEHQTPLPRRWTFWVNRMISGEPIGPVVPLAFSATKELNGFGSGTATFPLFDSPLTPYDLLRMWSWRLWVYYDGVPIWCGAPTGVIDEGSASATLTMSELGGYLHERQFEINKSYRQVEQTTIAKDLAAPLGAVGMSFVIDPGKGIKRDRDYVILDGESRAELLTNLANVIDGPEFRTEYGISTLTALPMASLRIAYPRVGTNTGLGLSVPGNLIEGYTATWDSENYRTKTFAVGSLPENAPDNAKQPVVVVDRPQSGIPQLDRVDDHSGTILLATLKDKANSAASIYNTPTLHVTGSVFETEPPLQRYGIGDIVTVNLRTSLLPDGYTTLARLSGISFDAATGRVEWTLAMTNPPAKPRATLSQRIASLDTSVAHIFRGPNLEVQT